MKLKIIILLLLFAISSPSSFAVIDIKNQESTESIQHSPNENFSKKKKLKKRKFKFRDFFNFKKKVKKAKKEDTIKDSPSASWSLVFGIIGCLTLILMVNNPNMVLVPLVFVIAEILALVLGITSLISIKKNPTKLKGKETAWAGILLALLSFLITVGLLLNFIANQ